MPVIYPLNLPAVSGQGSDMATFTLRKVEPMELTQSPFTGAQQVQISQGQWWEADIELIAFKREDAAQWEAFLLALRGSYGTFLLGDPERATPMGVGGGAPRVNGSGQGGDTLDIYNCPADVVGWLKAGDDVQLGAGGSARLHRLLEDIDTDSDGAASLRFWPNIRTSPAHDDPVTIDAPCGVFRLTPQSQNFPRVPLFTRIAFSAVEKVDGT